MTKKSIKKFTFKCHGTWTLECDPNEVYPNDPGMGTPLLIIAPNGSTVTLACGLDVGETDCGGKNTVQITAPVMCWLESIQDQAEAYVYGEQS